MIEGTEIRDMAEKGERGKRRDIEDRGREEISEREERDQGGEERGGERRPPIKRETGLIRLVTLRLSGVIHKNVVQNITKPS